jgi:hypothetical protein
MIRQTETNHECARKEPQDLRGARRIRPAGGVGENTRVGPAGGNDIVDRDAAGDAWPRD